MLELGMQSQYLVKDTCPETGFGALKRAGFSCTDFSLHGYLKNTDIYHGKLNEFFSKSLQELEEFFLPHKQAAKKNGVRVHQMHMPYPVYVPLASKEVNQYLRSEVAPKSIELCSFFDCRYLVVHGFKLSRFLGSEDAEWAEMEQFLCDIFPMAKERGITICVENLYESISGHIVEGPCCNADKAIERIDRWNEAYGAEVLGFCFDTGHANLIGIDFEEFLTALGHRLKVLHIHDNDGVMDLHQIPFTFAKTRENKASTDWEGFIRGLRRIHYDGVLNFEASPVLHAFPDALQMEVLKMLAGIGKYFSDRILEREE